MNYLLRYVINNFFALSLLVFISALFISCSDDERPTIGKLVVDSKSYNLKTGAIFPPSAVNLLVDEENGVWESGYEHDINFSDLDRCDLFITVLDKNLELESGTYAFSTERVPMSIESGYLSGDYTGSNNLTAGSLVVERNGRSYKFTLTATISGLPVTVTFSGKPQLDFEK
jgi:hypothetical protein